MSSSKIPSALSRQRAMMQSKFPPAVARDDDVQSVVSEAASVSSWTQVPQGQVHGQSSTESPDPWAETGEQTDSDGLKMPPADLKLGSIPEHGTADQAGRSHAAPVTQAAQNWGGSCQRDASSEAFEKGAREGRSQGQSLECNGSRWVLTMRWNVALPKHIQQVGSGEGERSVLVLDARDLRMQSPYQGWLLDEIITNAYAGINVLSDRQLVRGPLIGLPPQHLHVEDLGWAQARVVWLHDILVAEFRVVLGMLLQGRCYRIRPFNRSGGHWWARRVQRGWTWRWS